LPVHEVQWENKARFRDHIRSSFKKGESMGDTRQVSAAIQKTLEFSSRCQRAETSDNYGALEDQVGDLEGRAREAFQSQVNMAALLPKLQERKPLTADDMKTLELLMVGDAESYLKYETEVEHWKDELRRVLSEIGKLQTSLLTVDDLMHLRALCREAREALADLVFYFDAKERIAKFQAATTGSIDAEGYRVLAEIVTAMVSSDKM
jgi:hypothetical protein